MLVQDGMSKRVLWLRPGDLVGVADAMMHESKVRHMPVVDPETGALVGIVSRHDLSRRAVEIVRAAPACQDAWRMDGVRVQKVMTPSVVVAACDDALADAARTMREHRIGCLPVVSGGDLVGILAESDFVRLAAQGALEPLAEPDAP